MDLKNLTYFKNNYYFKFNIDTNLLISLTKNLSKNKWYNWENRKDKNKYIYPEFKNNTLNFKEIYYLNMITNTNTILENDKIFHKIIYNPEILKLVENYFNCKSKIVNVDIFYNENDGRFNEKNTDIKKLQYHIDDYHLIKKNNKKFCKLFIPLTDVNENNGVTHIVSGSANKIPKDAIKKLEILSTQRFDDKYIEKNFNKDIVKLNSKFGEIFLARTDGFHKGGFVKKGKRIIVIAEYNPI